MESVKAASRQSVSLVGQKARDYLQLIKLRLSLTVVFSSVMAFLIAGGGVYHWAALSLLAIGGFLVTAAANALNQVLEKDFDKLMKRTAGRPLAAGRMKVSEAVMAAGFMSLSGITILALFNPWTAFFGMLALMSYAFLYTPLKRITSHAVLVGAIPGALPVLIGCVAAEGELTVLALVLFSIQFFWQFPHFWSISWLGYEDYIRAGYKLMPSVGGKPDPRVGLHSFFYALLLLPVGLLPFLLGVSGPVSAVFLSGLGGLYAFLGWKFYRRRDRKAALQLMLFSFVYIPLAMTALFIDAI